MTTFKMTFEEGKEFTTTLREEGNMTANFGQVQLVHTDNYEDLYNKPSINEVTLIGNKTFEDLGDTPLTNLEIKRIFDRIFNGGN